MLRAFGLSRALLATLSLVVIAMAAVPGQAESTLERVTREDAIRVGVANEAPYGYVDESGRLTGESPEIARRVLAGIDPAIELEAVVVAFGELIPALNAGRFDMIAAGMYITPERCQRVAFTAPTYKIGEAFIVLAGNPKNLTDFQSVAANRDARVGIMAGSAEYNYAYEAGIPGDRALLYADYTAAMRALKSGEVDAVAMTSLTARTLIEQRDLDSVQATEQFYPRIGDQRKVGYGAFAFRKDDAELHEAFNDRLKDFIGTPGHWETVAPFGFDPQMLPDKTMEDLCAGG